MKARRGRPAHPRYRLLIRTSDQAMLLLDEHGVSVPFSHVKMYSSEDALVQPVDAIAAWLMDDEIRYVNEFLRVFGNCQYSS